MNFFKTFYKEIYNHLNIKNIIDSFYEFTNYLFYVPFIYVNFYYSPIRIKHMINIFYIMGSGCNITKFPLKKKLS